MTYTIKSYEALGTDYPYYCRIYDDADNLVYMSRSKVSAQNAKDLANNYLDKVVGLDLAETLLEEYTRIV